jgi:hypothetical protein
LVAGEAPVATAEVVRRAIDDVHALLDKGGPTNAVDRVHTSLQGHLQYLCDGAEIAYDKKNDPTTALLRKLRREHPRLRDLGPRSQDIEKVLNAAGAMLDALTPVRNNASLPTRTRSFSDAMKPNSS